MWWCCFGTKICSEDMGPMTKIQSYQQTRNCGGFVWLSNVQSDRDNIFYTEWLSLTQCALLTQRMRVLFLVMLKLDFLIQLGLIGDLSEKQ